MRDKLKQIIQKKCVIKGQFTLSSGKQSNFYLDSKMCTTDAQGLNIFAKLILQQIQELGANSVGGPMVGADPIVGGVLALAGEENIDLKGFLVRKQTKGHGLQKLIEGNFNAGDKVLVVEDVVTTGGSVLKAIQAIEAANAQIVGVICLVDREEGGAETLVKYNFKPVFKLNEVLN